MAYTEEVTANRSHASARQPGLRLSALATTVDQPFTLITSALLLVLSLLLYIYGFATARPGTHFAGLLYGNFNDTPIYYSYLRQAAAGHLFWQDLFTPEPQQARFFILLWWLVGSFAGLTGLSLETTYWVFHVCAVLGFTFVLAFCLGAFTQQLPVRRLALVLSCFGSGLSWLLYLCNQAVQHVLYTASPPFDLGLDALGGSDGITLSSAIFNPHLLVGMALLVTGITLLYRSLVQENWQLALWGGVCGLLLGFVHIYDLLTLFSVATGFTLLWIARQGKTRQCLCQLGVFLGLATPGLLYYLYVFSTDPILKAYQQANFIPAPPVFLVAMSFGLLFLIPLPFFRGFGDLHTTPPTVLLLQVWVLASLFLPYLPFIRFQVQMLNGLQLPLSLATAYLTLNTLAPACAALLGNTKSVAPHLLARWAPGILVSLVLLLSLPSHAFTYLTAIQELHAANSGFFYLSDDDLASLRWLQQHGRAGDVTISTQTYARFVPGWSGLKTLSSHDILTIDFPHKASLVGRFFSPGGDDGFRQRLIRQYHIRYIISGPEQAPLGQDYFDRRPYLQHVFRSATVQVYEVKEE